MLIDRLGSLHTQMESLIVLIALENRWPLEEMCYFNSREQTNHRAIITILEFIHRSPCIHPTNSWPIFPYTYTDVNKVRPRESVFPPPVLSHLRGLLAPDEALYECAKRAHQLQIRDWDKRRDETAGGRGGNFSAA